MEIQESIKNIKFGKYPQTANGDILPIEWEVLVKEENKMLVISKYGLEPMSFANSFDFHSINSWLDSRIRRWLNNDFYNGAFNEQERKNIKSFEGDNVFLLSKEEAEKYFANNDIRRCEATKYAVKNGAWVLDESYYCCWWLRSPNPNYSNSVYRVNGDGNIISCNVVGNVIVVRPTLWIKF